MESDDRESNPFESPQLKPAAVSQGPWIVLWGTTAVFVLVAILCIVFETLLLAPVVIVAIGLPALVRMVSDLNRKIAAGWIIDYGEQWKSLAVSLGISTLTMVSACIAGFTACFAGIEIGQGGGGATGTVGVGLMLLGIPIGMVVVGVMFYFLGPKKLEALKEDAAIRGRRRPSQSELDESEPPP